MNGISALLFIGRVSCPYTKHLRNVLLSLSKQSIFRPDSLERVFVPKGILVA